MRACCARTDDAFPAALPRFHAEEIERLLRRGGAWVANHPERELITRRYLRHDLQLPAAQVAASGYWKRGITNLDHHAPLDPSDPD